MATTSMVIFNLRFMFCISVLQLANGMGGSSRVQS